MENMPPGYRFYPTEEEIITFYLRNKLEGQKDQSMNRIIPVLNIYDYNPTQLPQLSGEASTRDTEQWFFFIPRQESEARGGRPRRLTTSGYWKATGSPSRVYSSDNQLIGMKRTMVFYNGRAPRGNKTDWKMNEYKAIQQVQGGGPGASSSQDPVLRQEFSLCRVYKKSKCLRAFDRRPSSPPIRRDIITGSSNPPHAQDDDEPHSQKGSPSHEHHHQVMEERSVVITSSPESSPSQEDGSGEAAPIDIDNEPLLDWEQVHWFLVSEP